MLNPDLPHGLLAYSFIRETETGEVKEALGDQCRYRGLGVGYQSQAETINLDSAKITKICPRVASFSTSCPALKTT